MRKTSKSTLKTKLQIMCTSNFPGWLCFTLDCFWTNFIHQKKCMSSSMKKWAVSWNQKNLCIMNKVKLFKWLIVYITWKVCCYNRSPVGEWQPSVAHKEADVIMNPWSCTISGSWWYRCAHHYSSSHMLMSMACHIAFKWGLCNYWFQWRLHNSMMQ